MKIVATERTNLRLIEISDSDFILKLVNTPKWIKFIGDKNIKTKSNAEDYIKNGPLKSYKDFGFGLWLISLKETNTPIGICGLLKRAYLDNPDIGFALLPEFEANGYGYEAALATLAFAQKKLFLNTILAIVTKENTKSRNLLKKIGMKEISTIQLNNNQDELLLYATN